LRQAIFFVLTVVLPCAVIAVMAARMLVQDRELVATRLADEQRRLVNDARQALLARVERLRLTGLAHSPDSPRSLPAELAVVAELNGRDFVLPWDDAHTRTSRTPGASQLRFRDAIARAERMEFAENDFASAAALYLRQAETTPATDERVWARLLAARAFTKAARPTQAQAAARLTLDTPPTLTDDQGIPYLVYAARMLAQPPVATAEDEATIVAAFRLALAAPGISPAAVYMMRDVVSALASRDIAGAIAARARDMEQTLALRAALPTLGIPVATNDADAVWVRFGPVDNLWLVSIGAAGDRRMVTAVRASPLIAAVESAAPVTITAAAEGEPLAPNVPGLRAVVSPAALTAVAEDSGRQQPFYLGAIALVTSVAVFGAALFWRDVRREIRVAELRSQFVSSVSHELKTPLTAIRMFAETLLMGRARPEVQHEYLETIVNESERLTRLLNNVLDFSSIESGKKTYRLEPQSLAAVVRAAAKAMEYPFSQQGFELRIAIDEGVPDVAADADAIQQAILNLLSNAVKYSGDGRIVDLELKRAGDDVVIAVTDRGFGIAAGEQSRIFEEYYRIRDQATDRVPGTGLGLTLVDHVARGHGGRVTVRSAPGQGSTFALTIPIGAHGAAAVAGSEVPA
jgi:signal transduction histidine kinase